MNKAKHEGNPVAEASRSNGGWLTKWGPLVVALVVVVGEELRGLHLQHLAAKTAGRQTLYEARLGPGRQAYSAMQDAIHKAENLALKVWPAEVQAEPERRLAWERVMDALEDVQRAGWELEAFLDENDILWLDKKQDEFSKILVSIMNAPTVEARTQLVTQYGPTRLALRRELSQMIFRKKRD